MTSIREQAYELAKGKIGVKESPVNSNKVEFSEWFGIVTPWCMEFVSWAFATAGSKDIFAPGQRWDYVPAFLNDAKAGKFGLKIVRDPIRGDLVCYDWPGESPGIPDHVGIFEAWVNQAAGTFTAIEGNTLVGNDSNGGEVMRRSRATSLVKNFVRVPETGGGFLAELTDDEQKEILAAARTLNAIVDGLQGMLKIGGKGSMQKFGESLANLLKKSGV